MIVLLVFLSLLAGSLMSKTHGQVIHDNFGIEDSYNTEMGWAIRQVSRENLQFGVLINPAVDIHLSYVDAAIGTVTFNSGDVATLSVYNAEDGSPDSVLESVSAGGLPEFGSGDPPTRFVFSGSTLLAANNIYFIIASTEVGSRLGWMLNNTGDVGNMVGRVGDSYQWSVFGPTELLAFRAVGTAVPEPTTSIVLLVLSIAVARSSQNTSIRRRETVSI